MAGHNTINHQLRLDSYADCHGSSDGRVDRSSCRGRVDHASYRGRSDHTGHEQ